MRAWYVVFDLERFVVHAEHFYDARRLAALELRRRGKFVAPMDLNGRVLGERDARAGEVR